MAIDGLSVRGEIGMQVLLISVRIDLPFETTDLFCANAERNRRAILDLSVSLIWRELQRRLGRLSKRAGRNASEA